MDIGIIGGSSLDEGLASLVMGKKALDHLISNSDTPRSSLSALSTDENLHKKLSDLVENSNSGNISWNYAIFWQLSTTTSGDYILAWGDGCCREPPEVEETDYASPKSVRVTKQKMRKLLLQNLCATFDGKEKDGSALRLDRISHVKMFFLASMYFMFPRGRGGLGFCFGSGKPMWINDPVSMPMIYCVRSFLAKSAGVRTVVMIPTDIGLVELGSVESVPESSEIIKMIKSSFSSFSPNVRVKQAAAVAALNDRSNDIPSPNFPTNENPKAFMDIGSAEPKGKAPAMAFVADNLTSSSFKKLRLGKDVNYVSAWTPYSLLEARNAMEPNSPKSQEKSIPEIASGPKEGLGLGNKDETRQAETQLSDISGSRKRRASEPLSDGREKAAANHAERARRRREKLAQHFQALRAVLPNVTKTDQVSLLDNAISHITELQQKIKKFEAGKEKLVMR